jgi:hypothetical protein
MSCGIVPLRGMSGVQGCRVFQKSCFDGPRFLTVVEGMLSSCDNKEFAFFVGTARRIWLR